MEVDGLDTSINLDLNCFILRRSRANRELAF
jgi:hypothetical protein